MILQTKQHFIIVLFCQSIRPLILASAKLKRLVMTISAPLMNRLLKKRKTVDPDIVIVVVNCCKIIRSNVLIVDPNNNVF